MDCAMSKEWQSVADQQVAPVDNKPFILDCLHYSLRHNQSIQSLFIAKLESINDSHSNPVTSKILPTKKFGYPKKFEHENISAT